MSLANPVFANLGCGPRGSGRIAPVFQGWEVLRVDAEAAVEPDIVADITDLSAVPDGAVDGVWCAHCLEHLYLHEAPGALAEMRRILAPHGILCLVVPDLQTVAQYIVADKMHEPLYQSPAGPITPHDVMFGYGRRIAEGFTLMAHRSGFTPQVMVDTLRAGGFEHFVVTRRSNFELGAVAHRTGWRSEAEREQVVAQLRL
jgi:predicted SAM-dependent methyltransferase